MLAFEVWLNGKKVALAGNDDLAVLTSTINAVGKLGSKTSRKGQGKDLFLNVGGLTSRKLGKPNEHLNWLRQKKLREGDEVRIRLVSVTKCDRPTHRSPADDNKRKDDEERRWFEMARDAYLKLKAKYEKLPANKPFQRTRSKQRASER